MALVFALCLVFQVYITLNFDERPIYYRNGPLFFLALVVAAAAVFAAGRLLRRLNPQRLFAALAILFAAAGLYLVLHVDASVRGDAGMIFKYVVPFSEGDYTGLTEGRYLRWYPYQLGMLTWEMLLGKISLNPRFFFCVNLLLAEGSNFLQWKLTEHLFPGNRAAANYAILLSFLFAPQFFFILFLYGQIPGLFFLEAGALCALFAAGDPAERETEQNSAVSRRARAAAGILSCVLTGISVLLKPNYMIGTIALAIVCFLRYLRGGQQAKRRAGLHCAALFLCAGLLIVPPVMQQGLYTYYRSESGIDFGSGAPMSTVIAMGLMESEGTREDGWYNGFEYDTFEAAGFDEAAADAVGRAKIRELLSEMAKDPVRAAGFFGRKIVSTWCDPLCGSVWAGPLPAADQQTYSAVLQNIYRGGRVYELLENWMNIEILVILAGALLTALSGLFPNGKREEADPLLLYPALYFLGGFLFHLASETKSQYIYMYLFSLIPLCAGTLGSISGRASGSDPAHNTRSAGTCAPREAAQTGSAEGNPQGSSE